MGKGLLFLIFRAFICTALPAKTASGEPFSLTGKMVKIGSVRSQVSSLTEIAARHVVTLTKSTGPLSRAAGRLYDFRIDTTAVNLSFQPQEIAGITIANDTTMQFVVPPPGFRIVELRVLDYLDGTTFPAEVYRRGQLLGTADSGGELTINIPASDGANDTLMVKLDGKIHETLQIYTFDGNANSNGVHTTGVAKDPDLQYEAMAQFSMIRFMT